MCLHGRASGSQAISDEAVPGKQALHSLICVNNFCMLPIEHPELPMPCYMLGKLRPLLVHGDREPMKCIDQRRYLQEHQNTQPSELEFPFMLQARSGLLPLGKGLSRTAA